MNKKLIAILTLVMFAITLLPMGAFAATTNIALQDVTVGSSTAERLATLRFAETESTISSVASGDTVTVTLLNGAEFKKGLVAPSAADINTAIKNKLPATSNISVTGTPTSNSFTLKVQRTEFGSALSFNVDFESAGIKVDTQDLTGDLVIANLQPSTPSGFTSGDVTLGRKVSKSTSATVLSQSTLTIGRSPQNIGTIRILENTSGAIAGDIKIATTNSEIKLIKTLPSVSTVGTGLDVNAAGYTHTNSNPDGYTEITIPVTSTSSSQGFVDITNLQVNVTDKASLGDVTLKISGGGDVTTQTIVVGTVKDYGITYTPGAEITLFAGDETETLKTFSIMENAEASIVTNGRTMKLTLPKDVAWVAEPTLNIDKGDITIPTFASFEDDRRTVVYTLPGNFSKQASKIEFKDGKVAAKATAKAGDLEIEFSGSANVDGKVKLGEIKKPLVVEGGSADIQIGKNAQPVGDIIIKEVKAGYIKAASDYNTLIVRLPENVKASATPVVEVVEGDIKIDKIERSSDNRNIVITIKNVSTVASTIKVSGLKVDVDRTLAEGPYNFTVTGNAVNRVYRAATVKTPATIAITVKDALDAKEFDAAATFQGMIIVTPAQDGVVKPVVMTVGSTVYTIDGVEMTMDVAPYIRDSRTYFPVRHVAQALGITSDNVVWDSAQRTVTIFRGNRIVQVTIGSRTMLVNGVPLTMDVAPEITADRTMLPIRFVAQGLGVNVDWDDATRTITLN